MPESVQPTEPTSAPVTAAWGPYCDKYGCRGRWHDDLPHTLCDKAMVQK